MGLRLLSLSLYLNKLTEKKKSVHEKIHYFYYYSSHTNKFIPLKRIYLKCTLCTSG